MIIVKTEKSKKLFTDCFGYDPSKRMQVMKRFSTTKGYTSNIKKEFNSLFVAVGGLIITPFVLVCQLFVALYSLVKWDLVYTTEELLDKK